MESPLETKREAYRRALDRALDALVSQLSALPAVRRIILFGSYAQGRRDLFTDIDLLVVMDSEQDFVSRNAAIRRLIHTEVDVDLLVYTPQEFERQKQRGFVRCVAETGKVLYEAQRS
ncbi:MAG: nucleotidyltransferase domain-containing protein [Anaerolineales bacterium]|nr:nucleotidyltransferase domain-containing protein [Anaerolineales bacterium]